MPEDSHNSSSARITIPVILAAGMGTRMKSSRPKMLHTVGGRSLIDHCVTMAERATDAQPVVVIGHGAEAVQQAVFSRADFVFQAEQLGTGHAALQAETLARGASQITLSYGDMPLLKPETLRKLIALREHTGAAVTMLSLVSDNARGFGRVVRDASGVCVLAVVEEVACTPQQLAINELNVGVYCFDGAWVWEALRRVQPNAQKAEYFITDLIEIANADGREVRAIVTRDAEECIGINTRADLADAEAALRRRINHTHMLNGVTLIDPVSTYIDAAVEIASDTVILPNTHLTGHTRIGTGSHIGPNTLLIETTIGNRCEIVASVLEHSVIADDVHVGPFAHFRPGARVETGAHVGNFTEIKNSTLGAGSHMGHFSYLGDAAVGEHVNIGAGTVTCNYDGVKKSRTIIGDHAFIGSDTLLVAPVTVGNGSQTGAGAVVTKDIPDNTLAIGVPAKAVRLIS